MNLVDLPSRFHSGRRGEPVRYIVRHTTEGTDSRTWLTEIGGVSAHYLVRGSTVYRLVDEADAAWHAGRVVGTPRSPLVVGGRDADGNWTPNPNSQSIGIEIEGFAAGPIDPETLAAVVELIRDIRTRHDVPCVDHRDISPGDRTDPGIWAEAIDRALEDDMPLSETDKDDIAQRTARLVVDAINAEANVVTPVELRRIARGADPAAPGNDQPIVAGEPLFPTTAK